MRPDDRTFKNQEESASVCGDSSHSLRHLRPGSRRHATDLVAAGPGPAVAMPPPPPPRCHRSRSTCSSRPTRARRPPPRRCSPPEPRCAPPRCFEPCRPSTGEDPRNELRHDTRVGRRAIVGRRRAAAAAPGRRALAVGADAEATYEGVVDPLRQEGAVAVEAAAAVDARQPVGEAALLPRSERPPASVSASSEPSGSSVCVAASR